MVVGDESVTQAMIDLGCLPKLIKHLNHPVVFIQRECAWALSNLSVSPKEQIQTVYDAGVLPAAVFKLKDPSVSEIVKVITKFFCLF